MSFLSELKRRNVVRVGIAYVVIAWLTAQVLQLVFQSFGTPDWVMKTVLVLMAAGLVFALFFSWAFELTPDGIKREKDVDRAQSITPSTGRKLDFLIIAVLGLALAYLAIDRFVLNPVGDPVEVLQPVTVGESADNPASVPSQQSIAVLPFVNMSDDKDYFADGLSEELLNLLARIPDLKVAGRTSSFVFKGRNEDLHAIGNALRVAHVLEGSVRRSGDRLRITAQLIKVEDGFHIWSETYDRQIADIFDIQDEVAGAITESLKLHLAPEADRLTSSPEAYSLYLEAQALVVADKTEDVITGLELVQQAIAIDPAFAKAYELKAQFHWLSGSWTTDSPEAQVATHRAASKALELDPTLVAARSLAETSKPDWNWTDEFLALERLVKAQPNYVSGLVSLVYACLNVGYYHEALPYADRIIQLEPLSSVGYWRKGQVLMAMGRAPEAYELFERTIELGNVFGSYFIGFDHLIMGRDEQAIPYLQAWVNAAGFKIDSVAEFIAQVRDPESGKALLDEFIQQGVLDATNIEERNSHYEWYLAFGFLDDYWEIIERLSEGETGWTNSETLEVQGVSHPGSGYTRDPRYLRKAAADSTMAVWEQRGPPDHCRKVDGSWVCG